MAHRTLHLYSRVLSCLPNGSNLDSELLAFLCIPSTNVVSVVFYRPSWCLDACPIKIVPSKPLNSPSARSFSHARSNAKQSTLGPGIQRRIASAIRVYDTTVQLDPRVLNSNYCNPEGRTAAIAGCARRRPVKSSETQTENSGLLYVAPTGESFGGRISTSLHATVSCAYHLPW